jgi:hypothetical protein
MSAFDPIPDIERLGYTPREAGFMALVAMHSGFFLRRHFNHYLHKGDGGLAHSFLTKALKNKHVQVLPLGQRRSVFHLCSRILYRLCGIKESQDRRTKADRTIKTMLLCLDYVIDHPHQHFFRTKQQKLEYFRDTLHISLNKLPSLDLVTPTAGKHRSYFPDRFPISILPETESQPRRISFCFVDDGIETLGPLWRFLLRHGQLVRSLPSSEIVYVAETKRHFVDAGRMLVRAFPKLDAGTVAARECPRGVDHFLSYLEAREVFEEAVVSPTFEQSGILAEGKAIYNTAAHHNLFNAWMRDDITDDEILVRYSEKQINVSIRGYVIQAVFPQNGPKYRGVE